MSSPTRPWRYRGLDVAGGGASDEAGCPVFPAARRATSVLGPLGGVRPRAAWWAPELQLGLGAGGDREQSLPWGAQSTASTRRACEAPGARSRTRASRTPDATTRPSTGARARRRSSHDHVRPARHRLGGRGGRRRLRVDDGHQRRFVAAAVTPAERNRQRRPSARDRRADPQERPPRPRGLDRRIARRPPGWRRRRVLGGVRRRRGWREARRPRHPTRSNRNHRRGLHVLVGRRQRRVQRLPERLPPTAATGPDPWRGSARSGGSSAPAAARDGATADSGTVMWWAQQLGEAALERQPPRRASRTAMHAERVDVRAVIDVPRRGTARATCSAACPSAMPVRVVCRASLVAEQLRDAEVEQLRRTTRRRCRRDDRCSRA